MTTSLTSVTAIKITELTGKKRELVLNRKSMPFRPTGIGGSHLRTKSKRYPGNPVASTQILGPEQLPNTIGGKWSERHLAFDGKILWDNFPLVRVNDVYDVVEELLAGGQMLKFEWNGLKNIGFLTDTAYNWGVTGEVEWSMTFNWVSNTEEADPPFMEKLSDIREEFDFTKDMAKRDISEAVELLRKVFESGELVTEVIVEGETLALEAAALASLVLEAGQLAKDEAERAMEAMYTASSLAYGLAHQTMAIAEFDQASYMGWNFGQGSRHRLPPASGSVNTSGVSQSGLSHGSFETGTSGNLQKNAELIGNRSMLASGEGSNEPGSIPAGWLNPEDSGFDDHWLNLTDLKTDRIASNPAKFLLKRTDKTKAIEKLLQASHAYSKSAESFRRFLSPSNNNIHRVLQDEDLRDISNIYYNTPDRWNEIAKFNNIEGSLPEMGTMLVIP